MTLLLLLLPPPLQLLHLDYCSQLREDSPSTSVAICAAQSCCGDKDQKFTRRAAITCLEVTAYLLRAELLAQREAASDDAEERLQSGAERFLKRKLRTQRCRVLHSSLCCPQAGTAALQELQLQELEASSKYKFFPHIPPLFLHRLSFLSSHSS